MLFGSVIGGLPRFAAQFPAVRRENLPAQAPVVWPPLGPPHASPQLAVNDLQPTVAGRRSTGCSPHLRLSVAPCPNSADSPGRNTTLPLPQRSRLSVPRGSPPQYSCLFWRWQCNGCCFFVRRRGAMAGKSERIRSDG